MTSIFPQDERAYALTLLDTALERFRTGKRAEAHDLFLEVGEITDGDIEAFASDAAAFLEDGGGRFESSEDLEAAFADLQATLDAEIEGDVLSL